MFDLPKTCLSDLQVDVGAGKRNVERYLKGAGHASLAPHFTELTEIRLYFSSSIFQFSSAPNFSTEMRF